MRPVAAAASIARAQTRRSSADDARTAVSRRSPRFRRARCACRARRADRRGAPQRRRGRARRRARQVSWPSHRWHRARFRWRGYERRRRARRRSVGADFRHRRGRTARRAEIAKSSASRRPKQSSTIRASSLAVSAVSHGFGKTPFDLRLLENGRLIDARRVTPAGDGTPVREIFQVSPGARSANRLQSRDTSRPRRAGAREQRPQHARPASHPSAARAARRRRARFRARLSEAGVGLGLRPRGRLCRPQRQERAGRRYLLHPGDAVARRAAHRRVSRESGGSLSLRCAGVCKRRGRTSSRQPQLDLTRSFVGERGGGLLVLGARSFLRQGLGGTPSRTCCRSISPTGGGDRAAGRRQSVARTAFADRGRRGTPVMQLGCGR